MSTLVVEQLIYSTAEDERNYFTGEYSDHITQVTVGESWMTPGEYRVVDGELRQVVTGVPPELHRR